MFEKMASSSEVNSIYSFFDALWCSEICYRGSMPSYYAEGEEKSELIQKTIAVKEERGWGKINHDYLKRIYTSYSRTNDFVESLRNTEELVSSETQLRTTIIYEYSVSEFEERIFRNDSDIRFIVNGEQFMLSITAAKYDEPDKFSAKWYSLGRKCKLHFALEAKVSEEWRLFPITWFGAPNCGYTDKYWNWGNMRFHEQAKHCCTGDGFERSNTLVRWEKICFTKEGYRPTNQEDSFKIRDDALCRLVAFEIN